MVFFKIFTWYLVSGRRIRTSTTGGQGTTTNRTVVRCLTL